MKKKILAALIIVLGIPFILPTASFAWRGGAGYYDGWGPHRPYGWHRPRVYVGTAFAGPRYVPFPVYTYSPPVVYVNPVPQPAYSCPDPGIVRQYTDESPPGQWVDVPGQWVEGKWIPSHKAWVAVNP
jgi:hypothetical protein